MADEFETEMAETLAELAKALEAYEAQPYGDEEAGAVDDAATRLGDQQSEHPAVEALSAVVALALEEDGFAYIPAARVLCAAVQKEF